MTVEPGWPSQAVRPISDARSAGGAFVGPRTKLVAAGEQLLIEHGDSSYTIEELVRRAGVAIKTFYRCFANKEEFRKEVFTAAVAESAPRFRESVLAASDDPLTRLHLAVTSALRLPLENEVASRAIAVEHVRMAAVSPETIAASSLPYEQFIRYLLDQALAAGQIRTTDPEWDARIITSMVTNSFLAMVLGLDRSNRTELAEHVWRFCLSALK